MIFSSGLFLSCQHNLSIIHFGKWMNAKQITIVNKNLYSKHH
jgi:hypothetical protein